MVFSVKLKGNDDFIKNVEAEDAEIAVHKYAKWLEKFLGRPDGETWRLVEVSDGETVEEFKFRGSFVFDLDSIYTVVGGDEDVSGLL